MLQLWANDKWRSAVCRRRSPSTTTTKTAKHLVTNVDWVEWNWKLSSCRKRIRIKSSRIQVKDIFRQIFVCLFRVNECKKKQKGESVANEIHWRLKVTIKDIRKRATSTELSTRVTHGVTANATSAMKWWQKIDLKREKNNPWSDSIKEKMSQPTFLALKTRQRWIQSKSKQTRKRKET